MATSFDTSLFVYKSVLRLLAFSAVLYFVCPCNALSTLERRKPTASFTARQIGSSNVLVGGAGREGTAWQGRFLDIKEATSDRVVLEFDLRGRQQAELVSLDFSLFNLDAPNFTEIFLYAFEGNGLANAADYFRTDNHVTTFTDNGLAIGPFLQDLPQFSLDVTTVYNDAVAEGDEYLGMLLRNTTTDPTYARYRLGNGSSSWPLPVLTIAVPEPTSIVTLLLSMIALSIRRVPLLACPAVRTL